MIRPECFGLHLVDKTIRGFTERLENDLYNKDVDDDFASQCSTKRCDYYMVTLDDLRAKENK